MLAQPQTVACTVLIEQVTPDADVADKWQIEGKILRSDPSVAGNVFFAENRRIKGFTFNLPEGIKEGATVKADVEFMGDPFTQNYQLKNVEPAT